MRCLGHAILCEFDEGEINASVGNGFLQHSFDTSNSSPPLGDSSEGESARVPDIDTLLRICVALEMQV